MKAQIFTLLFLSVTITALAQDKDKLFGPGEVPKARKGFILNGNGYFDIPGGDMAKRFGYSYRVGPALLYKTTSNWIFGTKFDFILGSKVKEDSLMINIRDKYSGSGGKTYEFINSSGQRVGVPVYERGYVTGVQVGKIINFSKQHPDDGLMLLTTAGFMQHKINIFDKDKTVPAIRGSLLKGYDRLTNGFFLEEYAGYTHFAKNGLLNFTIGFDFLVGFTQGRRDYLYDVMRPDNKQRVDMLYGIHGGWFIPIFKRKSEDIMFE
jgi:hypothetical protein